jgi:hypothetical protein
MATRLEDLPVTAAESAIISALRRFLDRDQAEIDSVDELRGRKGKRRICECGCCVEAREALAQIEGQE